MVSNDFYHPKVNFYRSIKTINSVNYGLFDSISEKNSRRAEKVNVAIQNLLDMRLAIDLTCQFKINLKSYQVIVFIKNICHSLCFLLFNQFVNTSSQRIMVTI